MLGPDITPMFLSTGNVKEKPTNPVTAKHGRCGFRRSAIWSQKNVSMIFVLSCRYFSLVVKYSPNLFRNVVEPQGSLFLSLSISVAGVSEAYEDAANCLWLLTNSKPCANCKSPIQKNEGCNHMQCAKVICVIIKIIIGFIFIPGYVWRGFCRGTGTLAWWEHFWKWKHDIKCF